MQRVPNGERRKGDAAQVAVQVCRIATGRGRPARPQRNGGLVGGKRRMEKQNGVRKGRPPSQMPQPINRSMSEIVRSVFRVPPKREAEWKYLREHQAANAARKAARQARSKPAGGGSDG